MWNFMLSLPHLEQLHLYIIITFCIHVKVGFHYFLWRPSCSLKHCCQSSQSSCFFYSHLSQISFPAYHFSFFATFSSLTICCFWLCHCKVSWQIATGRQRDNTTTLCCLWVHWITNAQLSITDGHGKKWCVWPLLMIHICCWCSESGAEQLAAKWYFMWLLTFNKPW